MRSTKFASLPKHLGTATAWWRRLSIQLWRIKHKRVTVSYILLSYCSKYTVKFNLHFLSAWRFGRRADTFIGWTNNKQILSDLLNLHLRHVMWQTSICNKTEMIIMSARSFASWAMIYFRHWTPNELWQPVQWPSTFCRLQRISLPEHWRQARPEREEEAHLSPLSCLFKMRPGS